MAKEKPRVPKVRRKWKIKPTTKIKDSDKKYSRRRVKKELKAELEENL